LELDLEWEVTEVFLKDVTILLTLEGCVLVELDKKMRTNVQARESPRTCRASKLLIEKRSCILLTDVFLVP
jgi:hypothetical protein